MPTYAYRCNACGERREVQHRMADRPDVACSNGHAMRKDIGAHFPHVSLLWHFDQGIGDKLCIQSVRRHGTTADADSARV